MKKEAWKKRLTENCQTIGTYKPAFENTIDRLARTLEKMDVAEEGFKKSGGDPVTIYTNGNTGTNSYLKVWIDLNSQAIKYLSELGLTPSGYKKITGEGKAKEERVDPLAKIFAEL